MHRDRPRARSLVIVASLALVAAVLIPVGALAGGASKGQVTTATASVDGGRTAAIAITIKNTSTSGNITAQGVRVYIDSDIAIANIQLPVVKPAAGTLTDPAVTLAASSPYIEILDANIARNKTYTVTLNTRIPCGTQGTVYDWVTDVRQSNDFSGTGNELPPKGAVARTTVVSGCSLAFTTQPKNAASGATITGTANDPTGPAVAVTVRSGGSGPVTVTWFAGAVAVTASPSTPLGGTTSQSVVNGVASFGNLSIAAGGTYSFLASAAGATGVTSAPFVIGFSAHADCNVDGLPCTTGTFAGPTGSTANVTVNDTDDEITGSLSAELTEDVLDCPGFDYEYGDTLVFSLTSSSNLVDYSKTVEFTKAAVYGTATSALWKYQVCFEADYPFASMVYSSDAQANYELLLNILAGGPLPTATQVSPGVYRGLLPECSLLASTGVDADLIGKMASGAPGAIGYPCVESRTFISSGTQMKTVARVPAADPQMR